MRILQKVPRCEQACKFEIKIGGDVDVTPNYVSCLNVRISVLFEAQKVGAYIEF